MVKERTRILMVGGGYVGMYTALRLQRKLKAELKRGEVEITVLSPDPYMTYQPFLPEAAAGSISPRHVVVPLRRVLDQCRIVIGEARSIDHAKRTVTLTTLATEEEGAGAEQISYDELVLAPGSISRALPIPGLAEYAIGFKTVEEAIGLRNHVIEQMDIASSTRDPAIRDAALTFVFVGGGYAGVEALGELEDMARYTARYYHNIRPEDMKWILVEASNRILPEVGEEMGKYTVTQLRRRNIDVRLETRLDSCADRIAVLSDGARFPTRTVVWTAGVKPHPILAASDLPLNERGRLKCTPADRRRRHARVGRGRRRRRPRRHHGTRHRHGAQRPARGTPGQGPRRQHRALPARGAARNVLPQVRRFGRVPGAAQRRRTRLRAQAEGLSCLVHAPRLPPEQGAYLQPQGPCARRMDPVGTLQEGDRLSRFTRTSPRGVRTRGRWKASSRPEARPEGVVLTGPWNSTGQDGV